MKKQLFISYSHIDVTKVNIIKKELTNHSSFEPIIIAFDREALRPLSTKVTEGIKKSDFILPILTSESIKTQWINQEIGYATALNKEIIPIVELECIDHLKGFIHKQIDLPYGYRLKAHKGIENKGFKKQFLQLISDLEKRQIKTNTPNTPINTHHDPIDRNMKGPNGQTVFASPKGGRYYIHNSGNKVFLVKTFPPPRNA